MRRPRGTGSLFRRKGSDNWWIQYYVNGKRIRESADSTVKGDATDRLKTRIGELTHGEFVQPNDRRLTVAELYQGLLDNYKMNNRASYSGAEERWNKRLNAFFGHLRAMQVSTELLNKYVLKCQDEYELSSGTINRDLAALKRAFNLAFRSTPRRVSQVPVFPHLKENPPRQGFVEQAQYAELRKHAGELWLRTLLAVAYSFGFRAGELMDMRVNQVDLLNSTIRLWRGETKNGEPRIVKLTPEASVLLTACLVGKGPQDFVFTRQSGKPVLDFRGAWQTMCEKAGLGKLTVDEGGSEHWTGLIFHDLRRSAVRNMVRSGIPERVAMTISGHATRSVFDRYNIVNEADLVEAARKIEQGQKPEFSHSLATVGSSERASEVKRLLYA